MKTYKQQVGKIGQNIAGDYLRRHKYIVIRRNYLRKWGEIDLIAQKNSTIYFFEVKTVTRCYICNDQKSINSYRAEDNMHLYKTERLKKTIQSYLAETKTDKREIEWKFDVIVIILDKKDLSLIKLDHLENIIL